MRNFSLVAAAALTALSAGIAQAAAPTLASVQAGLTAGTAKQYWIAGSSAAKKATAAFIGAQYCGGAANMTTFSSASPVSNPDFNAYSCSATAGPTSGALTVWYYRAEGGSVVGVLPVINNKTIKYLDLTAANTTCAGAAPTYNCPVAGTANGNGPNDSWGPAGVSGSGIAGSAPAVAPDFGISDAEPDAFVGSNSPYAAAPPAGYVAGTFGPAKTQAQLKAMAHTTIFQQTFGIVVNTALTQGNIGRNVVANILNGNYVDWSNVPDVTSATPGTAMVAASTPIFVCNREVGSGSRTVTDIFFTGDHCVPGASAIAEGAGGAISDNFATSDLLACVQGNGVPNGAAAGAIAIGYVSIDNYSKLGVAPYANVKSLQLDGVTASNYATAIGNYSYAFEATGNTNSASTNPVAAAMTASILTLIQNVNTGPQSAQVNAIPGQPAANTAVLPLQKVGAIYTTDFYRGGGQGNSCAAMNEAN